MNKNSAKYWPPWIFSTSPQKTDHPPFPQLHNKGLTTLHFFHLHNKVLSALHFFTFTTKYWPPCIFSPSQQSTDHPAFSHLHHKVMTTLRFLTFMAAKHWTCCVFLSSRQITYHQAIFFTFLTKSWWLCIFSPSRQSTDHAAFSYLHNKVLTTLHFLTFTTNYWPPCIF